MEIENLEKSIKKSEIELVKKTLTVLKKRRDKKEYGEIRNCYNSACDKLDILLSKLCQDL